MKAILLTTLALASSAIASPVLAQSTNNSTIAFNQTVIFISSILRGFQSGIEKGMYKNTNFVNDPNCLGNDT